MSVQTLYTAATGMNSLETKLDVIANNLANSNTTAFKRRSVNFEDLFYRNLKLPALQDASGNYTPYDIAISGRGFLQVNDPNSGQIVYTRSGNLSVNANGQLVIGSAQTGRVVQ